jgi:hypothetical protein
MPGDCDEKQLCTWYEQRFATAVKGLPERKPWLVEERARIADDLKQCLGIREKWVPALEVRTLKTATHEGFSIEYLRATSWPGVTATAHLYLPDGPRNEPLPAVFLGCGHGKGCKQSPGYQAMAFRLARMGAMVLVPDNIGQGEREPMGHRDVVEVFVHGLSLQGLIAMESIGWVRWLKKDRRVDVARIAAIGQSGGGP